MSDRPLRPGEIVTLTRFGNVAAYEVVELVDEQLVRLRVLTAPGLPEDYELTVLRSAVTRH